MPAAAHPSVAILASRCLLTLSVALLVPALSDSAELRGTDSPPEAQLLLAAMHEYASHYVATLPDFICLQTTNQLQSGKKGDRWKQLDSLTSKLVFAGGREHRTLALVNGQPVGSRRILRRPLTTEGEFAILISNIFGESSLAAFEWQGWQMFQGERCAVFGYRIDRAHSTMKLSLSDLATATVAYGGQVVADQTTGAIRRVTSEANDIPKEIRTRSIATVIDYWRVTVGNGSYLLPSDASVEIATPNGRVRNELHFRNYQKFEAESSITFDADTPSVPSAAPPPWF